jgi:hypothetical protein
MWFLCLILSANLGVGEPVIESWPDGTVRARYEIDEAGNRTGSYQEFHPNGKRAIKATYRKGLLSGTYQEFHASGKKALDCKYKNGELNGKYVSWNENGQELRVAAYRAGKLHGKAEAFEGKTRLVSQKWKAGQLTEINGLVPFPRPLAEVRATVLALTDGETPLPGSPPEPEIWATPDEVEAADPGLRAAREQALRTLVAYRYLCGVPHEGMSYDEEFNRVSTLGAKLCDAIGHLDHTPENPGWPADEFRDGYTGTSRSNLASVGDLRRSVHMYMDDSDPSNIDRVGHRVWCLSRGLGTVGFGRFKNYSAMYVQGGGGKGGGSKVVAYPPAGYMPTEYFGPRHAWSIGFGGGSVPDPKDLTIEIMPLDELFVPGPPLALDHVGRTGGLLVFRPVGLAVQDGAAYLVRIKGLGGPYKKKGYAYLVSFVDLRGEE